MTSGQKIVSRHVAKDRIISKYPEPYCNEATEYHRISFHHAVKSACSQDKAGLVGVKLSKVVLVGDVAVGKTCLVNRFCHDVFDRDYKATIGVDFEVEKFSILSMPFNLQIWDTAGQERFKCIAAAYYRGTQAVIATFDMSNGFSLENCRRWMEDAAENATDPLKFLVGSKKDLVAKEVFNEMEDRAKKIAAELGAEYWACSSKTGENVRELIFRIATLTFENAVLQEVEKSKASVTIGTLKLDRSDPDKYQRSSSGIKLPCCNT
ncbi:ras-related protein Rab-34-like isoform X2 [Lineus longissimus]|uniref:ras-related protein Rab-34-like isoform X2 n=1 Tax=Lineus longissimus TaxID=88925 RepID=UPI002B4DBD88